MKKLILFFFIALINFVSRGQTSFNHRYNSWYSTQELGNNIYSDTSGIYVVGNAIYSGGAQNQVRIIFTHLDHAGNRIYTKMHSYPFSYLYPGGNGGLQRIDDGFFLGASLQDTNDVDVYLMKLTLQGDTVWTSRIGDSLFNSSSFACQTNDGGYAFCGGTNSFNPNFGDILLGKTDSIGRVLWLKNYTTPNVTSIGTSVMQTSDNGFVMVGFETIASGIQVERLIKTDSLGNKQWGRMLAPSQNCTPHAMINTRDGNIVICGARRLNTGINETAFVTKININGNNMWERFYFTDPLVSYGGFTSIKELPEGSFIATGYEKLNGQTGNRGALFKIANNGDSIWTHNYYAGYPTNRNELYHITTEIDGSILAVGL